MVSTGLRCSVAFAAQRRATIRTMRRAAALAVTTALLASACTTSKPAAPGPSAASQPALSRAQVALAALATRAAGAAYDATYRLTTTLSSKPGTIRVITLPPGRIRVDVTTQGVVASSYMTSIGAVSCKTQKGKKPTCLLVARPGEKVPSAFDPGVQRLFSDAAAELGRDPGTFDVSALPARPKSGKLPAATCFHVQRKTTAALPAQDPSGFETGDYCFSAGGVPTSLKVNYGTLSLAALGARPTAKLFVPPVKPMQLPALTPPPKPSTNPSSSPRRS
jgi:hypothetical protein